MPKSKEQCEEIKKEMKKTILQKSLLYFARNGLKGTKISDLAKHIGIAQGTIYIYFKSKEELYKEIQKIADFNNDAKKLKLLTLMPISADKKIHKLSKFILDNIEKDELFASKIAISTPISLEVDDNKSFEETIYQNDLYKYMSKIIEQGQKEGSVVKGEIIKLTDYYFGVVYVYALKRLFTTSYIMITPEDLERTIRR